VKGVVQAEFPSIPVEPDFDISLPEIEADPEQLTQAVLNVVRNAAQALAGTTADPRITLATRVARYVTLARRHHRLALSIAVTDNGPGIPPAIRDRIFYPLVSGREGGSGLGLTIAQTFVAQHGGTIECESEPGRTEFRILLPVDTSRPVAPATGP
jgi:two-component system nitrogen regulation sensor histidine kinase GlnL